MTHLVSWSVAVDSTTGGRAMASRPEEDYSFRSRAAKK
jgi:hypothetical protein